MLKAPPPILVLVACAGALAQPDPAAPPPATRHAAPGALRAPTYDLMVGDPAPALAIDTWIKGDPVAHFEQGKVYVVEFWATWCPPCIAAMPHLSALQEQHKDAGLTVIGVTCPDASGNTLQAAEAMTRDKAGAMGCTVAWDGHRRTWDAFMRAAGRGGIPCSFIIDRHGRVAYIGHPGAMDSALEQVIAGTLDLDKARADYARTVVAQEVLRPLLATLRSAGMRQQWDEALAAADEIERLDPASAPELAVPRFEILIVKGDWARASIYARQAIDGPARDDPNRLNSISWTIVDPKGLVKEKDLDAALAAASRAVELAPENPSFLDTLATVHHLRGEHERAVEIQTGAARLSPKDAEIQAHLEQFKAALDRARGER